MEFSAAFLEFLRSALFFVPLGFLFTLLGFLRGEILAGLVSWVINLIGLFTSPILISMLGLGVLFSNLPASNHTVHEVSPSSSSHTVDNQDAESRARRILESKPDSAQTPTKFEEDDQTKVDLIHPGFDCYKARTLTEKLICLDEELAQLDNELAGLYSQAKAVSVDGIAFKNATRAAWNWREKNCTDKPCLLEWYADRKRDFLFALDSAGEPKLKSTENSAPP